VTPIVGYALTLVLAVAAALVAYRTGTRHLGALRAIAVALAVALLLDLPAGRGRTASPVVALDVSASWTRGGDAGRWAAARDAARAAGGDSVVLLGDSVRTGAPPEAPSDGASRVAPLVDRARAVGRPVRLFSDGELDDAAALADLPAGSELVVTGAPARADLGIARLDAPAAVLTGDSTDVRVTLAADSLPLAAPHLRVLVDRTAVLDTSLAPIAPWGERLVDLRIAAGGRAGARALTAVVQVAGDVEARNDSARVAVEVRELPAVVAVSTAPDNDLRFLLTVLRGALALPTRAYLRVAPGQWRVDGTLAPVSEDAVRAAVREARLLVLHGDTAYFGAPSGVGRGGLALLPAIAATTEEWYASGTRPSPLGVALGGLPWDSLPPLGLAAGGAGDSGFVALVATRPRLGGERAVVTGVEHPRRRLVVRAYGFWRWRQRGGVGADAFTAFWGAAFDWLVGAERRVAPARADSAVASRELMPRRPAASGGAIGGAPVGGATPRLRDAWWAWVALVGALCAEWILRRRVGLR
jgi:hypothetical protein